MTPHKLAGHGIGSAVGFGVLAFVAIRAMVAAQAPLPVTGTIALEGTTEKVYTAANTVIVKTIDGIEHIFRFTRDLLVHGGKGEGVNALVGLREGTTVVVHYTVADGTKTVHELDRVSDDEGLKIGEGMVNRIDRRRKQIVVRFDNGTTETFRMTNVVTENGDRNIGASQRVIVYYSEEGRDKVAHYFKKVS